MFRFGCLIVIIALVGIKSKEDELLSNPRGIWWPLSCLVYGVPVSDDSDSTNALDDDLSDIKFILFSKDPNVADVVLIPDDIGTIVTSKFIPILPTRILVHGWRDNSSNPLTQVVKDAYFTRSALNNVIGIDWGKYADSLNYPVVAQEYVPKVGYLLAKFLEFLVRKLLVPVFNIQLIGHSLGAQVCGYAGQFFADFGLGQLPVIVGLDPALPLFQNTPPDRHLDETDAGYVEVIHTAASCKGFDEQVGTADFYPNFSRWRHKQPGCGLDPVWACSHSRAYYYFAESVTNDGSFRSVHCKSFEELEGESCDKSEGEANMGGYFGRKKEATGLYYLKTHDKPPYSLN